MAIIKLRSGKHQVKVRGSDGKWMTKAFESHREAELHEAKLKTQKLSGEHLTNNANRITVKEFYDRWFPAIEHRATPGWRSCQKQLFRDYIEPVLGHRKLKTVTPVMVAEVLKQLVEKKRSEQTQQHVFNFLRKMFRDAIELYQLLSFNPVLKNLKVKVPLKEARYLNLEQVRTLLQHVSDKEYGLAISLQLYMGLRVSEVIALRWSDLDLADGVLSVCRAYSRKDSWVRKEPVFKEYPKGRKQHSHRIPAELLEGLKEAKQTAKSEFVAATSYKSEPLSYEHYLKTLKAYCKEAKLPPVGTHGLRHSTSELYLHHGATRDDLRRLFAHSSLSVTDRYVHNRGTHLETVSNVIRLFPECSTDVPSGRKNGGSRSALTTM